MYEVFALAEVVVFVYYEAAALMVYALSVDELEDIKLLKREDRVCLYILNEKYQD